VESLGEKLKSAREARDLDYEQVSRDTNIAIRYLEALEAEHFDSFPGEPYITGFLRTYGAYLGIESQELISSYRALKIQEQPVPEELLKKLAPAPGAKIALVTVIILAILGGIGGGVYYFITRPEKPEVLPPTGRTAVEYTMTGDTLERRLYPGDSILVPVENTRYKLELGSLRDTVTIRTPLGFERIELGQTVTVDLNANGADDIRITAADFVKNNAEMGALIRIELNVPAALGIEPGAEPFSGTSVNSPASTVIFSSPNAYPFTLQSNFQGYCLFRWEILSERDRRNRNEQYFQRDSELSIQAQNGIRIWTSNAQAAKIQIIGGGRTVPVELGGPGEVVVAEVRWLRDEDNRYRLMLVRLDT
jgi:cytoskeletal protein RodZ